MGLIAKPKDDLPLSDYDVLIMHVDLGRSMSRKFREMNEEINLLKAENKVLKEKLSQFTSI